MRAPWFSVELIVLRESVGDGEPRRLRADEDVRRGTDGRFIAKRPERYVDELTFSNHGIKEGTALRAPCVVGKFLSEDEQGFGPLAEDELLTLDTRERLEGSPSSAAAVRAMAIECVAEAIFDRVPDGTA
jgi:hypothetical protein